MTDAERTLKQISQLLGNPKDIVKAVKQEVEKQKKLLLEIEKYKSKE